MGNSNQSIANKKASDGTERIIKMAEKEQDMRHKIEKKLSTWGICVMVLGIAAGIVALLFIGYLIKYAIDNDAQNVAIVLSSTSLVGVIGIFVWFRIGKKSSK